MDYSKVNLLAMMKTRMAYISERQNVVAHNIANIDTPGFKAKDLKKLDFERLAMIEARRLQMRATAPTHIAGNKGNNASFKDEHERMTFETTPVKNNVVLEEQMIKVAENNTNYQMTTNLYKKTVDLFKVAIGNR